MYRAIKPENRIEKLVYWSIVGTYVIYGLGLLYPVNSLFAWGIFAYLCYCQWQSQKNNSNYSDNDYNYEEYINRQQAKAQISIPPIMWVWLIGMLVMGIGTVFSCFHVGLGLTETIREIIRWGTRGALLALFPLLGCLAIRPEIIYRAVCILCLQSLLIIPVCYAAYFAGLPDPLYDMSIFDKVTAAGELYYQVRFYSLGDALRTSQELRLFLFTPWGPALGLVGSIYFFVTLQEKNKTWRMIGVLGAIAMCIVSGSRTAIVTLPIVLLLTLVLNFKNLGFLIRPRTQIMAGFVFFLGGLFSSFILNTAENAVDSFVGARSKSSRVRAALARIGLRRWKDSPIWGYAQQVEGPEAVAKMPIGSHHTWVGLLYLKGIVGFISLLIPVLISFIFLLFKSQTSDRAKLGLKILLVLILYSFAEEIYLLAYIYWPALVLLGMAFNDTVPIKYTPETSYYLSPLSTNVN